MLTNYVGQVFGFSHLPGLLYCPRFSFYVYSLSSWFDTTFGLYLDDNDDTLSTQYEADGAHVGVDELEPCITRAAADDPAATCTETCSCPAPMYFSNGIYRGTYSNIPELTGESNGTTTIGEDDFGLDYVEPQFFWPLDAWEEAGGSEGFAAYLKFDQVIAQDIFYFCHIHSGMAGRIKLLGTFLFFCNSDGEYGNVCIGRKTHLSESLLCVTPLSNRREWHGIGGGRYAGNPLLANRY